MAILNNEQVEQKLKELDVSWSIIGGHSLNRVFRFVDFDQGLYFINKIAPIASNLNHHPDIELNYDKVVINLSTHSEGGLTDKDFQFARQIDQHQE